MRNVRLDIFFILLFWAIIGIFVGWIFRSDGIDFMQYESDAWYFYDVASTGKFNFESSVIYFLTHENLLPIFIYDLLYSTLLKFSITLDPIYGILVNSVVIVFINYWTVGLSSKVLNTNRKQSLIQANLLGSFGISLLFGGIHLRDCWAMLLVVISVRYFHKGLYRKVSVLKNFFVLLSLMAVGYLIRTEMLIIPLIAYCATIFVNRRKNIGNGVVFYAVLILASYAVIQYYHLIVGQYDKYLELTESNVRDSSIAFSLIYEQPIFVATFFSSILIAFIKFPFYSGMFRDSYSFFMAIASLQMIFFIPYFLKNSVGVIYSGSKLRASYVYFLVVILVMLIAVSLTSHQARHFFVVYPLMVLVVVPYQEVLLGLRLQKLYTQLAYVLLALVFSLHLFLAFRLVF
jgi:hypothetical protein